MELNICETLEKQLQLLSERSQQDINNMNLADISFAMLEICKFLNAQHFDRKPYSNVPLNKIP